ncbi:MAG: hypothetical protein IMZ66_12965, partial [Planctomycetes bacterium]|nr:hypothetical protein [Planctomycetota bacterium]
MAARSRVVFVVSSQFEDTRELLRRAAATETFEVNLVKGDASLDDAGAALARADRVWFEGTGPLLARLAETEAAGEAVLRIAADDVAALPVP